ncbi:spore photoproduct lyase family protein, partial [Streptomyces roseolus]
MGRSQETDGEAEGLFGVAELVAASAPAGAREGRAFRDGPEAARLLRVAEIHAEPGAAASWRGRQIIARFPGARLVETGSHWRIPHLHGNEGNVEHWVRVKRETLVLGERSSLAVRPNGRSADWIAPGLSNGCAMACAYCYVPRRKGFANP